MPNPLFDPRLRALRRDRACRSGPELFLHQRAFSDVLERLQLIRRSFSSALLIGCPDRGWPERLSQVAGHIEIIEPGPAFAAQARARHGSEESLELEQGAYDLCIAIGTLDTVNALPGALQQIARALRPDSLFIGVLAGGDTLPQLRAAMRAADEQMGAASPHAHPRIEAATLASLLNAAGFVMPVVDVDRVQVSYGSLSDLVRDLRAMGATNVLSARSRQPLTRRAANAAMLRFSEAGGGGRTQEQFELLHFAAWTRA